MNKEFIPYDRALRLKALGFDEPCLAGWCHPSEEIKEPFLQFNQECEYDIEAPTFSQAFRWFREKHDLHLLPIRSVDKWYSTFECWIASFNSYEEAELACLDRLIDLIEQR